MLLFDDTAGSELIKLRSQKDLMFKALNNEQRDIGVNQTENIGGDETINVGARSKCPHLRHGRRQLDPQRGHRRRRSMSDRRRCRWR